MFGFGTQPNSSLMQPLAPVNLLVVNNGQVSNQGAVPVNLVPVNLQPVAQYGAPPQVAPLAPYPAGLLTVAPEQPGQDGKHGHHGHYSLPLYEHLPVPLLRLELERGRVRWHGPDSLFADFLFYLRCNHEALALLWVPTGHPSSRSTRIVMLFFSFMFGIMFECAVTAVVSKEPEYQRWVTSAILGCFQFAFFFVMERFFTCSCVRSKLDEENLRALESGTVVKHQKIKETSFLALQCCSGVGAFCCYLPAALGCFFGAVAIQADSYNISYERSLGFTSYIWIVGWSTGQLYGLVSNAAFFAYAYSVKEKEFKQPGAYGDKMMPV